MWRRILLIAKRDYIATVFTRAFLFGLVIMPLMMGGGFFGAALLQKARGVRDRHIAIVDHTGAVAQDLIADATKRTNDVPAAQATQAILNSHYVFEVVPADHANPKAQRLELSDRIRSGDLFMYLEVGPKVLEPGSADDPEATVRAAARGDGIDDTRSWVNATINTVIHQHRLRKLGLDADQAQDALSAVQVERVGLSTMDDLGEVQSAAPRNEASAIIVPIALVVLMFMNVMGGSGPMLAAIAEDKVQRVFEMMLVTITPFELMMGKVLASLGRSLTSSVFYIVGAILGLQGAAMLGLVPFHLLPWFFFYVVAEVLILSSLAAALGSAVSNSRDAQQFGFLMSIPILIPMFMMGALIQEPNGPLATTLSFVPPLTPMLMMLRQAAPGDGVPVWHPWVGAVGILAFTWFSVWAASRVFRIAILAQGKTPTIGELARWAVRG